jgi:DNA polymerase-1
MSTKTEEKLVLLDAHAILHRAYHALPDFTSSAGEPTGALYGLSAFLIKLIRDLKPDYIAACYDLPGPTFRHEAYKEYKGTRAKTDEALISQLIRSRDVFKAFDIPVYDAPGFEADDIIGTIVEKCAKSDFAHSIQIIIASGDMDTLQLVEDNNTVVYTLKKGMSDTIIYNEAAVVERFGFPPRLLTDYKGLRGDPSDNIPGVKGIGEKTATDLIKNFGSIEEIYKKLKEDRESFKKAGVKERIIKLLEDNEEEALFSKTLASIRRDAPIDFELGSKKWPEIFDRNKVARLFGELGFRSLIGRLEAGEEKVSRDGEGLKEAALALWMLDSRKTDADVNTILDFAGVSTLREAKEAIEKKIEAAGRLGEVYRDIELPLIPILEAAEKRGIRIDAGYLAELSRKYHDELSAREKKIWEQTGEKFNINSPKQLGEILFVKLGLSAKGMKKTAGGARSTRESELEKLAGTNPVVDDILAYRELQKLLSTYIDVLPALADKDGRVHTHFVQTGTATGRMSSRDPNLQNIPAKTEIGRVIRKAFVADPGYVFLDFDYSQIELRVLAMLSGDHSLRRVFQEGGDIHQEVAEQVFNVPHDEVTKEMRRRAKVINFGIIYGMGVNALKQNLGTTREEAQKFYDEYFHDFPKVGEWMEATKQFAREHGYTETLYGRRRYFPNISEGPEYMRAAEERMAVNAPDQGTAADIVKIAMIRADKALREKKFDENARLLLQVHDELLYEVKEDIAEDVAVLVKNIMESVMKEAPPRGLCPAGKVISDIPLVANVLRGKNWGELK